MKSLFYGIGVATLSGLMLGGALQPDLMMDRIGGPQIAIGDSGRAAYGDFDGGTTHYPYGVPDYVVGTDHLYQSAAYEPEPEALYAEADWRGSPSDLPAYEPASYTGDPLPTYDAVVHYPSQGGGILAGIQPAVQKVPVAVEPAETASAPVDLGDEVFEPASAPAAAMAAFEMDMGG